MRETAGWGQGHRLLFVVNESYFFYSHRLPVARAAREAGFEVHVAAPDDHVWAASGFDVDALQAEGFLYHRIDLNHRGLNPLQDLRTMLAMWSLYRELRPTLLHHLTIKPVLYGGLAARLLNVPGVVNAVTGLGHLFSSGRPSARLLRGLIVPFYKLSLGNPRCRVIVQNAEDGELLQTHGIVAGERLRLIRGSGVAMNEFVPAPETDDTPLVVLPARLIWAKGVREFVDAARTLRRQGVPGRFALVGEAKAGYSGAVPEAELRRWHLDGDVEWWGRQEDMQAVFRRCHVVCLPSNYGEGVPKVLIEAAASGRAIVTTDIAGCRDIVRDGVNGILTPPSDADALARALKALLTDPDYRRRLAANGRRVVEEDFALDRVVAATLDVYRELLPASTKGAASLSASSRSSSK